MPAAKSSKKVASATPTGLAVKMLEDMARSALTQTDATKLNVQPLTAAQCNGLKLPSATDGYKLPYFDIDGKPLPFFRVRYLQDTRKGFAAYTKRKPIKYGQPFESPAEVYFPPLINWRTILSKTVPLLITEGEKKAACATKHGLPCIGLGGVWSFMSKRAGQTLLPVFKEMNLNNRVVIICFDSDAATNTDIVLAECRLAGRLLQEGAVVKIARIPTDGDSKVGLDDYIVAHGVTKFKTDIVDTATDFEGSVALHEMNSRATYIRNPGVVYLHTQEQKLRPGDFTQHAMSNVWHDDKVLAANGDVKVKKVQTAKAWLDWPQRAELKGIVYRPGAPHITMDGYLNGWQGWGFQEPVKGNIQPWAKLLDWLFGDEIEGRDWFERWLAYPVQYPGIKLTSAALLWGARHGSGKTLVGRTMMRLYGENSTEVKDADLQSTRFEWAENRQFVLGDDITGTTNRKQANMFKTMITQETLRIDAKYIPSYSIKDCINYYFTSNDPDALFLDDDDRRHFIHEVRVGRLSREDKEAFVAWMNSEEGIAALAWHLLHLDLGDFDPYGEALVTNSKRSMNNISKSELGDWVMQLKEQPERVLNGKGLGDLYSSQDLKAIFDPASEKKTSPNAIARELKRAGFNQVADGAPIRTITGGQIRVFAIKNNDKWEHAPWSEAAAHYDDSRKMLPAAKQRKF